MDHFCPPLCDLYVVDWAFNVKHQRYRLLAFPFPISSKPSHHKRGSRLTTRRCVLHLQARSERRKVNDCVAGGFTGLLSWRRLARAACRVAGKDTRSLRGRGLSS